MIRGALPILLAASLVAKLARTAPPGTGAGRYSWRRNSFFEARREGRRRAARNRRKAARS